MMRRSTWSAVLGRPAATRRANVSTASGAVRRLRSAAFTISPLRCSSHALRSARGKSELSAGGPAAGACASSTSRTPMTLVMRDPRERQAGHEMIPRMNLSELRRVVDAPGHRPAPLNRQKTGKGDRKQGKGTGNRGQGTGNRGQGTGNRGQETGD